jgi:CRP/FNR family transcriptional regulator, polysaccharide utilization system transcription regulator
MAAGILTLKPLGMTQFHRSVSCINCDKCNDRIGLFVGLLNEEVKLINDKRYEVKFRAGENIIKQGTASSNLVFLTSGLAKEYIEGYDQRNLILEIIKPYEVFGGTGIYVDYRYHYSVSALEEVTACFVDTLNFKKLIRMNPDFSERYMNYCGTCSTRTFERFVSLTQKQMHGRIADVLIYLAENIYNSQTFEIALSRQDISEFSGMSKDSAIRILKEFESEGIIHANGKSITINKMDLLMEISAKG